MCSTTFKLELTKQKQKIKKIYNLKQMVPNGLERGLEAPTPLQECVKVGAFCIEGSTS